MWFPNLQIREKRLFECWGVANIPYKSNSKPSLGCCPVLNPEVCRLALSVV